jgi:hypothetical protein
VINLAGKEVFHKKNNDLGNLVSVLFSSFVRITFVGRFNHQCNCSTK